MGTRETKPATFTCEHCGYEVTELAGATGLPQRTVHGLLPNSEVLPNSVTVSVSFADEAFTPPPRSSCELSDS